MTGEAVPTAGSEPSTTDYGDGTPTYVGPVMLVGTCDWGGCNMPAVTVRWSRSHGWLSVCQSCHRTAAQPWRRDPQALRMMAGAT